MERLALRDILLKRIKGWFPLTRMTIIIIIICLCFYLFNAYIQVKLLLENIYKIVTISYKIC